MVNSSLGILAIVMTLPVGQVTYHIYGGTCYVTSIQVSKEYRNNGLGTAMMYRLAKQLKSKYSHVRDIELDNMLSGERRFYQRMGFFYLSVDNVGNPSGPEMKTRVINVMRHCAVQDVTLVNRRFIFRCTKSTKSTKSGIIILFLKDPNHLAPNC